MTNEDEFLLHLLERAIKIAVNSHSNQFDKAGIPYILHPIRVMGGVKTVKEKIIAILHDTVEDTEVTLNYLKEEGFTEDIIDSIDALTRRKGETYKNFILRIKQNDMARRVKIVDLRDNADLFRLHTIEDDHIRLMKRYHEAMIELRKDGKVYITK
jgi:(p)ppGpp synthase/HD superfamily hydrolase